MDVNLHTQSSKIRVACFIDGFNLYHAICELNRDELKWVNLRALMEQFIDRSKQEIVAVYYFSAFAYWLPAQRARHESYVLALRHYGVTPVMGQFKEKPGQCLKCGCRWTAHEEKQSDVNIALWMFREAYRSSYDEAFLVSQDSDLKPALELICEMPKVSRIKVIGTPNRFHSKELGKVAHKLAKISVFHLERCLLPAKVLDANGKLIAKRPIEYNPPLGA